MSTDDEGFGQLLQDVASRHADAPFVWEGGTHYSYDHARRGADVLNAHLQSNDTIALILDKRIETYCLTWGAAVIGATYIPLNPNWNASRTFQVLENLRPHVIACEAGWLAEHDTKLKGLGYHLDGRFELPFPAKLDADDVVLLKTDHRLDFPTENVRTNGVKNGLANIMFTSGSTGEPKGIPVFRAGLVHYLLTMCDTLGIGEGETFTQLHELSFDLATHDMMLAWVTGGCAVSIPNVQAPFGPRFVRRLEIQNWTSVPTIAGKAASLGFLKPDAMPSLRRTIFGGETLPRDIAQSWSAATPNAETFNFYGPTETTVFASYHKFDVNSDETMVPIGKPLPGYKMRLVNGEIEIGGPQVFSGYINNPKQTEKALYTDEAGENWYRTGDLGTCTAEGAFRFLGRRDFQVKVKGHRIELTEIEIALRATTGKGLAVAVAVDQLAPGSFASIWAFVEGEVPENIGQSLATHLPAYMSPSKIIGLNEFPRNSNGKVDRLALSELANSSLAEGGDHC